MADVWKYTILALDIAGYFFAFLLIPRIILERRHPSATLAWMLGIALLPLIGVPLYFLIGVGRIRRHIQAKIATVVPVASSLSHPTPPPSGGVSPGPPPRGRGRGSASCCSSTPCGRGGRSGGPSAPCGTRAERWRPSCRRFPSTAGGRPTCGTTGSS